MYMVDKQKEEAYLSGIENSFYYPYRAGWQKKSKPIASDSKCLWYLDESKKNSKKVGHSRVDV